LGQEIYYLQALGARQGLAHPGELLEEPVLELPVSCSVHMFNRIVEYSGTVKMSVILARRAAGLIYSLEWVEGVFSEVRP
jgi:hypothetical protein